MRAGQSVVANSNGKKGFFIPVSWEVCDFVEVQADTLEEAYEWIKEHSDEIPLGTEPEYVDASYQVGEFEECKCYLDEAVEYPCAYKRKATNIIWDFDKGDGELPPDLPNKVAIPATIANDDIADYLSDCWGYLVVSFDLEKDLEKEVPSNSDTVGQTNEEEIER